MFRFRNQNISNRDGINYMYFKLRQVLIMTCSLFWIILFLIDYVDDKTVFDLVSFLLLTCKMFLEAASIRIANKVTVFLHLSVCLSFLIIQCLNINLIHTKEMSIFFSFMSLSIASTLMYIHILYQHKKGQTNLNTRFVTLE